MAKCVMVWGSRFCVSQDPPLDMRSDTGDLELNVHISASPCVCSSCRWVWWMHKSKILTTNNLVLWFCPCCFLPLTVNLLSVPPYLHLPGESSTVYSVVFLFCLFIHPTGQFMMCTTVLPDHLPIRVDHINDFEEDPRKMTFFKVSGVFCQYLGSDSGFDMCSLLIWCAVLFNTIIINTKKHNVSPYFL